MTGTKKNRPQPRPNQNAFLNIKQLSKIPYKIQILAMLEIIHDGEKDTEQKMYFGVYITYCCLALFFLVYTSLFWRKSYIHRPNEEL